jgi:hypothetical protein
MRLGSPLRGAAFNENMEQVDPPLSLPPIEHHDGCSVASVPGN